MQVMAIDPPRLWWGAVPDAQPVVTVADRGLAHAIARYVESVEWAVQVLAVNGPAWFSLLHEVAAGARPVADLDVAVELVPAHDAQVHLVGGRGMLGVEHIADLSGVDSLDPRVRAELDAAVPRVVGRLLHQAYDQASRLSALRAAAEGVLSRVSQRAGAGQPPVRLRPDVDHSLLECMRCLCEFRVDPYCVPGDGAERFGAPSTVSVEWRDCGIDLAVDLGAEEDDCPCHGDDVVMAWAGRDSHVLADVAASLGRPHGACSPARLAIGTELVLDLPGGRHLAVRRRAQDDRWEHALWEGPAISVTSVSSRRLAPVGRLLECPSDNGPDAAANLADAIRRVLLGTDR